MTFSELLKLAEFSSHVVTSVGLPFAIATFIIQKSKEKAAGEENTFHQLDDSYVSFLRLCLDNSDLDIFDEPIKTGYHPSDEQLRREQAIFAILISLFERAYVMFKDKSPEFRGAQWRGWIKFMESYCGRSNYKKVWQSIGSQFDMEYFEFMQELVGKSTIASQSPPSGEGKLTQ